MADLAADQQTAEAVAPEQAAAAGETDRQAIVVHEDALDAAFQAASRSIDQLLWHGSADVAKSVTVFGPGIVVLPLFGKVSGIDEHKCLAYAAHPKRVAKGGLMDRVDFESKFGMLAPGPLIHELVGGRPGLDKRLRAMTDEELRGEVNALQDWREKANGRLKTLEKRAAWSFLGMPPGSASQSAIKKAFKKKALELHPDKGGDAGRFQLLQEMKELLIVPTVKELEEFEKEAKEREAEVERAREKEKERDQKQKEKEDEEKDEEADFSDISSDSSYDVDEQFKKMFPKKKKKKKEAKEEDNFDGDLDLGKVENFNRDRHEAARRKLHRNFVEMWERAGKLAEEIKRAQANGGGEAMRQLRKFVDRFANLEVSKLKENDPKKAERIFRRFLEQGAEVICAAGAVDPLATVSSVAMQVNYPLLSAASSEDLEQRCNALLDAIKSLPSIFDKYVMPAEDVAVSRIAAARGMAIHLRLLVPDPALTSKRPDGLELPGVSEVKVELPPGSTLADLRAAALHMCRSDIFHQIAPRLFCGGRFIGGSDSMPLSDVEALRDGLPVQCLPSNRILQPKARAKSAAAAAPMPQAHAASQGSAAPPAAARPEQAGDAAAATPASGPTEDPRSTGRAEAKSPASSIHRPSPELLSALGVNGAKPGAKDVPDAEKDAKAAQEADRKAKEEQDQKASEERRAAERRAKEEVERKAAEDEACEEDPWFDDFFTDAKKAADSKAEKQRQEEEARLAAERAEKAKQEEAEEQKRQEERLRRNAEQEAGKSAMDARLRAQKQAQEAKKKLEKEKKKLEKEKKKAEAQQQAAQGDDNSGGKHEAAQSKAPAEPKKQPPAASPVRELVKAKDDPVLTVQRRRTSWDSSWCSPCAGERRRDGSAIFCYPCDDWIYVGDPYDHRSFDLHCEKVGHYGWID